jgi:CRP-like cAMP-binding protein
VRRVELGEVLFEPGLTNAPFRVLLSGSLDILQPDGTGGERAIVTYQAGSLGAGFLKPASSSSSIPNNCTPCWLGMSN